jgi:hypothetical protein
VSTSPERCDGSPMSAGADALMFLCAAYPGSLVRASPPELHAALLSLDAQLLPQHKLACEATLRAFDDDGATTAELHLRLPAGWPDTAHARVAVSCATRPRAWEVASSATLQAVVDADADGLASLLSTLTALLETTPPPAPAPRQLLLCSLEHMHDLVGYTRTLSGWALELGLRGRLLFAGNAILLLVEGEAEASGTLLLYLRTRIVDVDCRGRPCKERLLRVLYESEAASGAAEALGETFEVKKFDSASPALAILTAVGIPVEIWP